GNFSRVDGRKSSSNYCSTVTVTVFVAVCLVGVWVFTSSSVTPFQTLDGSDEPKNDVKTSVTGDNADSALDRNQANGDSEN
ncbi:hypothetical protein M569_02048, partial [Genlisea aurea]